MIIFKVLLVLFFMGWAFLLLIVAGETHSMNYPNSIFTKWWRRYWIDTEK
jgi:hypothetical protein